MEEEHYTVQESARILRTTERTVRRRLERGDLEVVMSLEQQAKFWQSELRALAEDTRTGADPFGVRLRSYELAQRVVRTAQREDDPEAARGLAHVSELVAGGHFFAARDALLLETTPS